jgi:N-formylmaleamate deformylase
MYIYIQIYYFMFFLKKLRLLLLIFPIYLQAQQETPHSFGVKIFGHGRPMILIPGMRGDGEGTFATTIAHYKSNYTCYVITLAGFAGQPASGKTIEPLKGQRDELIQYIKDKKMDKPVLVGFSFGGLLALWMASTAPALFGPIIDLDAAPYEAALETPNVNSDSLRQVVANKISTTANASPETIAKRDSARHSPASEKRGFQQLKTLITDTTKIPMVSEWDKKSDFRASTLLALEIEPIDLSDSIANIQSPILVLGSWKGFDVLTTEHEVETAMRKQFTKAKDVQIAYSKEGRHFFMWDDFNWMVGEMDKFLAGH